MRTGIAYSHGSSSLNVQSLTTFLHHWSNYLVVSKSQEDGSAVRYQCSYYKKLSWCIQASFSQLSAYMPLSETDDYKKTDLFLNLRKIAERNAKT
ncbi:hypothetical protein A4244_06330 [Bacillus badius]|nr:hypothetical protein A4244_06330 [Bacillus badius]OCS83664.1 hypothetical protein A6M11_06335 [Bacillus badius]OVE53049.1 hypothetical protein B1A98_05545 [Bacillus badius]